MPILLKREEYLLLELGAILLVEVEEACVSRIKRKHHGIVHNFDRG